MILDLKLCHKRNSLYPKNKLHNFMQNMLVEGRSDCGSGGVVLVFVDVVMLMWMCVCVVSVAIAVSVAVFPISVCRKDVPFIPPYLNL